LEALPNASLTGPTQDDEDFNPCAERWKNMQDELTSRMWGLFDENGVFMAFCRHGFALIITDMVRSGEQYVFYIFWVPCQC